MEGSTKEIGYGHLTRAASEKNHVYDLVRSFWPVEIRPEISSESSVADSVLPIPKSAP
jgi:hypothetical protein